MLINKKFKPEINVRHFVSSNDYKNRSRDVIEEKSINNEIVFSASCQWCYNKNYYQIYYLKCNFALQCRWKKVT